MSNILTTLGNIPVTSSVIASLYPDVKTKFAKVAQLERAGEIIRLRRNLFVVNPEETGKPLSSGLIANHLLAPSYVSMQTALRYYGLIPEAVYTIQSMTFKAAKEFNTPVGNYCYYHISRETYPIGITQIKDGNSVYIMATPEKALCDLIANQPGINLRYKKEALEFLEENLRFDMDRFCQLNPEIFLAYAKTGKKSTSILTILKLLQHE
ncbi:type IV toxin-antitoxin system AbiEi family antitoxin domain-containing protein [Prevotella sp.]|uniref:type IV toxin-antitoxin system AbiEi family antitoxin domain-containing protein n=1 Tax=Prevotella sp. TaxID=59823 RepID=UPI00307A492F